MLRRKYVETLKAFDLVEVTLYSGIPSVRTCTNEDTSAIRKMSAICREVPLYHVHVQSYWWLTEFGYFVHVWSRAHCFLLGFFFFSNPISRKGYLEFCEQDTSWHKKYIVSKLIMAYLQL